MWEQVQWAMIESAREVCGSVRGGGERTQRVCGGMMRLSRRWCWQLAIKRQKKDGRKRKVKKYAYQSKKNVNEHYRRKMNEEMN